MSGANDFAIVTPSVGKWIVLAGVIAVETQSRRFPDQVATDVSLEVLAVSCTVDFVSHETNIYA
jgi:hypothetical protein